METLNYKNFFLESPLYATIPVIKENISEVLNILYFDKNLGITHAKILDTTCMNCDNSTTFISEEAPTINVMYDELETLLDRSLDHIIKDQKEKVFSDTLRALESITFFERIFYCPKENHINSHKLIFFLKIENGKLSKIGQSQSVASLQKNNIKGLRELNKDIYKEYNSAIGLASHGVGIGAFVYLRRIIEKHIVIPEGEKMITSGQITKEDFERMRFAEKIKTVKNSIPDFLVENKSIYGILSKGIHELTEKECKTYFPVVKSAIDIILKDLITKKEEEKSRNQLKIKLEELAAQ